VHRREQEVNPAIRALLNREDSDTDLRIVLAAAGVRPVELEFALVAGAADPELLTRVADAAVREDKGAFVRTHLLAGEIPAADPEEGELRVAAL
jgi:hypothetical protein